MKPMTCERCGAPVVQGRAECEYCGVRFDGAPARPPQTGATGDARVLDALRRGLKIEAIRIHREIHRTGLREAKDAVDALELAMQGKR